MNRLIMIYGCVLLSSTAVAAIQGSPFELTPLNEMEQDIARFETEMAMVEPKRMDNLEEITFPIDVTEVESYDLDISTIEYMEEENIELGFDPNDYLPPHFNPYTYYFDLSSIEFDTGDDSSLDFNTAAFLPAGFDAYKAPTDLASVYFMEEEEIDLGFDTSKYLPEGFSPYEAYFDLNSIHYIEMDRLEEECLVLPSSNLLVEEPLN